jgi:hypothetical protein
MKGYRTLDPEQTLLFPVSPREWLPQDDLVFCVLDLIGQPELTRIIGKYQERDVRGEEAYHQAMMTALVVLDTR